VLPAAGRTSILDQILDLEALNAAAAVSSIANYLAYFAARLSPTKWIVSSPTLADGMFHRHC
jgi:hypothetical protein